MTSSKIIATYDVEVLSNFFSVVVDLSGFVDTVYIHPAKGSSIDYLRGYLNSLTSDDDVVLAGYNNWKYDDLILAYVVEKLNSGEDNVADLTNDIYNFSKFIIEGGAYEAQKLYKLGQSTIDLQEVLGLKNKSLKEVGHRLGHPNLQDMPVDYDAPVLESDIAPMLAYNRIDVEITSMLLDFARTTVDDRLSIVGTKGLTFKEAFTRSAKLAEVYIGKTVQLSYPTDVETSFPFSDLFKGRKPEFISPDVTEFIESVWDTEINDAKFEGSVKLNGRVIDIKSGGLHTVDQPYIYSSEDGLLYFLDVSSYYPNVMVNEGIYPPHLDPESIESVIREELALKSSSKKSGDKVAEKTHKLVLNALYGQLGNQFGKLYYPKGRLAVCVVGQIRLIQLIDLLEDRGYKVISGNTDGLYVLDANGLGEDYLLENLSLWSNEHNYVLDFDRVNSYYAKNISMYFADINGRLKTKGVFAMDEAVDFMHLQKQPKHRIVYTAVMDYFLNGTPIEETIRGCSDLYQFLIMTKASRQFNVFSVSEDDLSDLTMLTNHNRFYVSSSGGSLYKAYKDKDRTIRLDFGKPVVVVNDLPDEFPSDIDYQFYIDKCRKVIAEMTPTYEFMFSRLKCWGVVNTEEGTFEFPTSAGTGTKIQATNLAKKNNKLSGSEKFKLAVWLIDPFYAVVNDESEDSIYSHIPDNRYTKVGVYAGRVTKDNDSIVFNNYITITNLSKLQIPIKYNFKN